MKETIKKYRIDNMSLEELHALKDWINLSSDEQIEKELLEDWQQYDGKDTPSTDRLAHIWNNIETRIPQQNNKPARKIGQTMWRWFQIAASILLPIALIATIFLYKDNKTLLAEEVIFKTRTSEQATVTLPDGTTVALNSESELRYTPSLFSRSERRVELNGEGLFKVTKDKKRPFVIGAESATVKVLGTKFNFRDRRGESTATLTLLEGSVLMTSELNAQAVTLSPNQHVVLDKKSGIMQVSTLSNPEDTYAWQRKEMVFRNTPLSNVLEEIEKNYNVDFKISGKINTDQLFTGTMMTDNLNENLEILEISCHLKFTIDGKKIQVLP
jgi:transmembrane sensor